MGSTRLCCTMIMTMVVLIAGRASTVVGQQLAENFYAGSCPNVEAVVQQAVRAKARNNLATIPGTLRMFFHDCFVTGCDASVMVATPNGDAEKDAPDNLSLAGDGFDTIIKAKTAVEAVCPGVVSCADIMAMAGGPSFKVELGRRDSIVSSASLVAGNLPEPSMTLPQLNAIFWKNNLTQFDMIALSGAHTRIAKRIYSWSPNSTVDPSLDPTYSKELMKQCKPNANPNIAISIDPTTPSTFDNVYYQNLIGGKGLFTSDQVLYTDSRSKPTVVDFANNAGDFNGAFVMAMRKLGRVGVKTGKQGRIRSECTDINS
ncbi:Peroxidase 55 [Linum perenne]